MYGMNLICPVGSDTNVIGTGNRVLRSSFCGYIANWSSMKKRLQLFNFFERKKNGHFTSERYKVCSAKRNDINWQT